MNTPQNPLLVVDTNVWLGNFIDGRANTESARELFDLAAAMGTPLLYPASIAKDLFFLVEKDVKEKTRQEKDCLTVPDALAARAVAWGCLENMREMGTAIGCDEADLWLACKLRGLHSDFEDNLVLAAAERAHADFIVTDDEQLLRKATIPAKTSHDMAELLKFQQTLKP